MTFKEQLIEKANLVDIQKEIECIKQDMLEYSSSREYRIHLYDARVPMAIGTKSGSKTNHMSFFVPSKIRPEDYRALFIKSLKELGFTDDDIATDTDHSSDYDVYNITVRW